MTVANPIPPHKLLFSLLFPCRFSSTQMGSFVKHILLCNTATHHQTPPPAPLKCRCSSTPDMAPSRRQVIASTLFSATMLPAMQWTPLAIAENWGTHSLMKERYFQPQISPEDAVARIQQTAEGMKSMRHMLDAMAWRYVLFYVRLKMTYLSSDLPNAMTTLPENRRPAFVKTANELVGNIAELDRYISSPKVYESYLYYEKTLKSLDDVIALLAA